MNHTTINDFKRATYYPHWRNPQRRVALVIAGALHNVGTYETTGYGEPTRVLARKVRDRILARLEAGHSMDFISLKQ